MSSKRFPHLIAAVACLALAACGTSGGGGGGGGTTSPPPPLPTGTTADSMNFGGHVRTWIAHVPATGSGERPLVLVFHGGGGSGAGTERTYDWDALSDNQGFVVVYPDGLDFGGGRNWADGRGTTGPDVHGVDDVGFLRALVSRLSQQTGIDPLRIYAAGM